MTTSLKIALAKKKVIKSAITKLSTEYQGKTLDTSVVDLYDKKYSKLVKELDEVFRDIFTECKEAELEGFAEEQQIISDQLDEIWLDIRKERTKLNPVSSTSNGIPHASAARPDTGIEPGIRLPVLSLPHFQGQIRDWLSFADLFKASVHNNPSLSNVQKLSYLKMSLQGDAAKIIQSLPISEDNYATAWSLLEERYSNKREQIYAHIKKFFTMSTIQSDSPNAILTLVDTVNECVRSLEILGQKVNNFAEILFCYTINQKLDSNTRMWYERQFTTADQLPQLQSLLDFLKNQSRMIQASKNNPSVAHPKRSSMQRATTMIAGDKNSNTICALCSSSHKLYLCPEFLKWTVNKRNDFVKKKKLCFVCLDRHLLKSCTSPYKCHCGLRHSGILHFNKQNESSLNRESEEGKNQHSNSETTKTLIACDLLPNTTTRSSPLDPNAAAFDQGHSQTRDNCFAAALTKENQTLCGVRESLLTTAVIHLRDGTGMYQPIRSILDSGSTRCFLTNNCANRLMLPKQKTNINVNCLNASQINIKNKVATTVSNKCDFQRTLEFLLIPRITDKLPFNPIKVSPDQLPQVPMADPTWYRPSRVEALLGVECFYELFREGTISVPNTQLKLYNSVFGFIITGTVDIARGENQVHCGMVCGGDKQQGESEDDLLVQLQKFWEIEGGNLENSDKNKSKEEIICEEHFVHTHTRDSEGRYIVKIPLREDPACLGESRGIAIGRLNANYRRLVKEPAHLTLYNQFMHEYLQLGHMEEVHEKCPPPVNYYLPHHGVFRVQSTTTPVRVVYNGSSLTSTGRSLNELQLNGGVIQDNLVEIMLRFRNHKIGFIADIQKMYRAIWVDPSQRDLLRIVWKTGLHEPIKTYRLTTVTYGLTSSPFLATRALKQLVIDEGGSFPLAAPVALQDFYVDDIVSGTRDLEAAKALKNEICALLQKGGMYLHKWASNNPELLSDQSTTESNYKFHDETKALGISWLPGPDVFVYHVTIPNQGIFTKRSVLSNIAKLWDPLGLISPVLTSAKIFMKILWALKLDWNDPLPDDQTLEWKKFLVSLTAINDLKVNRYVYVDHAVIFEIHGFSDASEQAYGACIYAKTVDESGEVNSHLLCSKSRIAPTKTISIPKLELCAALLLAKLHRCVIKALQFKVHQSFFWCDSTIVLGWLRKEPYLLKSFVANRVAMIQQLTDIAQWQHVPSELNPADLVSRGVEAHQLCKAEIWWVGPPFIQQGDFPETVELQPSTEYLQELKCQPVISMNCTTNSATFINHLLLLTNVYTKLLYVLSYICRFIYNCKNPTKKINGPITGQEFERAAIWLIKTVQKEVFQRDLKHLKKGKPFLLSNKLKDLHPFLDNDEILRVGGRLHHAGISDARKHPVILPGGHKLSKMIAQYIHVKHMHAGPQSLLFWMRQTFWPINGRNLCRNTVHNCVTCVKMRPVVSEQLMGSLPPERVNKDFVFNNCGLDFCGPFTIKYRNQRRGCYHKVYICIFVCMVTKAVHLELVDDLSTEAFIAALKRFFARRGRAKKLFSDNGTNFVGAHAEIKRLHKLASVHDQQLSGYLTTEGVEWSFIPPTSPHHGGLWEAGVKSFKYHFRRVVGNAKLTYEQLLTITNQIESMLNSRPLTPLTSSADDLDILTPGHFLIGRPLNTLPEPDLSDVLTNRLSLWQKMTKMVQQVWKKWSDSYLSTLQQRGKWKFIKDNVKLGTIVVLKEENLPPNKWILGRIVELIPGRDNLVRIVRVKTKSGVFKRSIAKVCILPIDT